MKQRISFLLLSTSLLTACGVKEVDHETNHNDATLIQRKFEDKQVQVLLADLKAADKDKLEKYRMTLKAISNSIAKGWQVEPNKLAINSYLKLTGLQEEYRTYSYRNDKIQTSGTVPQHIKDSFGKHYVCYPPQYWKQFNIDQAVGFSWDTLGVEMKVDVIKVK